MVRRARSDRMMHKPVTPAGWGLKQVLISISDGNVEQSEVLKFSPQSRKDRRKKRMEGRNEGGEKGRK